MSKLNRREFKELLTEWRSNFINEFYDTSKEKHKYYFDANKRQIKKGDGDSGDPPVIDDGGGGGGGGKSIYATWWHDMIRLSLTSPQENELNVESEDYIDPSIKDPDHFFFDQKKYKDYLENNNLDRNYHDYMIDLQLKAIHNIVPISNKGNISDDNWYIALFFPESSYNEYVSFNLSNILRDLASCKEDNKVNLRFIPKSKEMSDLLKKGKGIFSEFNKDSDIVIDSIDHSEYFYMSTMSDYLEEVSPFNFSTNREEDIEALKEALSYIIEECDLAYDLDIKVVKEGHSFNQYENQLDEFESGHNKEFLEKNLNLLYKILSWHKKRNY